MIDPKLIFFFFLFIHQSFLLAASCCGGTANVPSLISGDDQSQLTATFSSADVVAEAPVTGGLKYRRENDRETLQTLRFDGAMLLSDKMQAGLSVPLMRRARNRGSAASDSLGLGDAILTLGYEALSEWSYTDWQPRGIFFVSGTLPTGGSIYEARKLYSVDSRGRGFWTLGTGALFIKSLGIWDFSLLLEGHRSFPREIRNELGVLKLNPGWGGSGLLALGISPGYGRFRLGLSVAPSFEDSTATEELFVGAGEPITIWTTSAQVNYLINRTRSVSLIYSDQTIIQSSQNAPLNRSLALLFQTRWER